MKEANVYGVTVPYRDGRAGMASLVVDPDIFDLDQLYKRYSYTERVHTYVQREMSEERQRKRNLKEVYWHFPTLLVTRCRSELPSYAAPLFLRITNEMSITSTFKHKKADLRSQGFNPDKVRVQLPSLPPAHLKSRHRRRRRCSWPCNCRLQSAAAGHAACPAQARCRHLRAWPSEELKGKEGAARVRINDVRKRQMGELEEGGRLT